MMVLWILIVDIIAAVFTVILEDEGADGKISLATYSEALEEKSKEFTSEVKSYASGDYDRIYYDTSPDDNTKEILSMMAVVEPTRINTG